MSLPRKLEILKCCGGTRTPRSKLFLSVLLCRVKEWSPNLYASTQPLDASETAWTTECLKAPALLKIEEAKEAFREEKIERERLERERLERERLERESKESKERLEKERVEKLDKEKLDKEAAKLKETGGDIVGGDSTDSSDEEEPRGD